MTHNDSFQSDELLEDAERFEFEFNAEDIDRGTHVSVQGKFQIFDQSGASI